MSNKKTQKGQRKSLLMGASVLAAAAASLAGAPAYAQDAEEDEEAIVVTGTRLVRQDFEAISPVTTVGSEQLELTATMTTESLLNELPQIIPGNTRTSNNSGGFDYATVDLRGLGPGRTLVLINGERVPVSSTGGAVDINTIPASLISRVEVVTGGASAVYGSDAMAGVVNFVLKDDYEGAEVTMTYGAEMETGNVGEFEINGLVGGNFANGRGNITTYASYYHREGILQSEYDFSRTSGAICYDPNVGTGAAGYYICDSNADITGTINGPDGIYGTADDGFGSVAAGGSGTPAWGTVYNNAGNAFNAAVLNAGINTAAQFASYDHDCNPATPNVAYGSTPGPFNGRAVATPTRNLSFDVNGNLTPGYTAAACAVPDRAAGSSRYNYAPDNFLVIPAERIALTTNGHYDFENDVRLNFMINYSNSRSEVQLAPTPATGLTVTLTDNMQALIQANHPDLWDALQSRPTPLAPFTMDRRMNEVGTRNSFFENNSVFFISGLEGALGENWDWALSASYGQNSFNSRAINSTNATALRQGLAGCQNFVDGAGNDTPLGVTALPGCVPLDIFGEGTLTDEMVSFITVPTFTDVVIEESRVAGFVRGDLFELPAGPLAVVLGFEYRDTFAGQYNDNEQRTGNIFGFNAVQDQEGQIDVYELYTEAAVPLITEAPFAHYLGLEAGYRLSNYSSVGNVETYKIGGEWAPSEWLRFRGIFNVATRAPNVFELYQNGDQGFPAFTDPCRDTDADGIPNQNEDAITGNEVLVAQCTGDGVVYPGFTATNAQVEAFAFGNPNLSPEESESTTYGVVFQPDWFPVGTLRASVDYYDIEITQVIAALGAQFFLNDCYQNGTVASCDRIVRLPGGQVDSVETTRSNQGSLATQGYDIQVEWSVPVGPGQLTINELYSILDDWQFNGNSFAGTTSAAIGGAFPDYKSVLSVTYNVGDWTLFGRWSYVPEMIGSTVGEDTPEASYFDASARWAVTDNFTLTANVDNLLDESPPQTIDGYFSQANTDPQVYRVLGRTLSVSGRYRF